MEYAYTIQPNSISIHFSDGAAFVLSADRPEFSKAKEAIKRGSDAAELRGIVDTVKKVSEATNTGLLKVTRDGVYFNGTLVDTPLTQRIMWFVEEQLPMRPLMNFAEKLFQNTRRSAVLSLYSFIEANDIPITEDGDFIVYKKVRGDYKDIHSGTYDNSVGSRPRVMPWEVEENRDITCAKGLHVCSRAYLPHFGSCSGDRVVICKVDPRDVVVVPNDYNNAKMRTCGYEVIGELTDAQRAEDFSKVAVLSRGAQHEGVTFGDYWRDQPSYEEESDDECEDTCDCGYPDSECDWPYCDERSDAEEPELEACDCGRDSSDCEWPDCPEGRAFDADCSDMKNKFTWGDKSSD